MKPPVVPLAFSYIRFSSPEQARGDSVRRQEHMRDAWCSRNGVKLDTSLSLRDEGVSAFTGEHQANPDRHALAAFLDLVRQKRVPRGSYLIIENLDRLTREDAVPALNLFTGILSAGVRVVQLDPESVYTDKSEYMEILRALLELSRGNSESKNKSRRMGAVWSEKRRRAAAEGAVLSRACPAWIRVEGEGKAARYVLVPERAAVVRRIFRMAIDGHGCLAIVKAFTREKVPGFAAKPWNKTYLRTILKNRSAFGEFTPRTGRGSSYKRKPTGPPIEGYYPAAVTRDDWYAAQTALAARREKGGRPSKAVVNVFGAMLWDARSGGRLHVKKYGGTGRRPIAALAPYEGVLYRAVYASFPLDAFEEGIFSELSEINSRDVLPAANAAAHRLAALRGELTEVEQQLLKFKDRLRKGEELDTLIDLVREGEARRNELLPLVEAAQREAECPAAEAWGEAKSLLKTLADAPDQDAARVRLRGMIRRTVESVWCLFVPGRGDRLAAVQVWFHGGAHRDYLILYRPPHPIKGGKLRPAVTLPQSFKDAGLSGGLDLRKREHAAELEKVLAAVTLKKPAGK